MNTVKKCPICGHNSFEIFSSMSGEIFQCEFCKLGFLFSIPRAKFLKKLYTAEYFNKQDSESGYKNYKKMRKALEKEGDRKINFMKKYVKNRTKLLDLGSGPGDFAIQTRKTNLKPEVLDISSWAINFAKKRGLKGYVSDFGFGSLPKKKYEIITAWDVIEHFRDPLKSFRALNHIMAKNALLFLTTPNLNSLDRKILGRYWYGFKKIPEHIFYFSPNSLKYLASITQFEVLEVKTWGFERSLEFFSEKLSNYNIFVSKISLVLLRILRITDKSIFFPLVDMMVVLRKKDSLE